MPHKKLIVRAPKNSLNIGISLYQSLHHPLRRGGLFEGGLYKGGLFEGAYYLFEDQTWDLFEALTFWLELTQGFRIIQYRSYSIEIKMQISQIDKLHFVIYEFLIFR